MSLPSICVVNRVVSCCRSLVGRGGESSMSTSLSSPSTCVPAGGDGDVGTGGGVMLFGLSASFRQSLAEAAYGLYLVARIKGFFSTSGVLF